MSQIDDEAQHGHRVERRRTLSQALREAGAEEDDGTEIRRTRYLPPETTPVLRVDPASVIIDDMPHRMRDDAVIFTLEALERYTVEQNVATYVKFRMDTSYEPQWHVIVGRSYGCKVTHEFHMCLLLSFHGLKILIFKAG